MASQSVRYRAANSSGMVWFNLAAPKRRKRVIYETEGRPTMANGIPELRRFRANLGAQPRTRRNRIFEAHVVGSKLDEMLVCAVLSGDIHTLPDEVVGAHQIHQWLLSIPTKITLDVTPQFKAELEKCANSQGMTLQEYVISRCKPG